jgi:2'-5' RNA ligase
LRGELASLAALQGGIEALAQTAGFAPESRRFTPHLTIARAQKSASPALLASAGEILRAESGGGSIPEAGVFGVQAIHLIHSDLRPHGPYYTPLAHFPLAS